MQVEEEADAAQNEDIEEILKLYEIENENDPEGSLNNSLGTKDQDQVNEDTEPLNLGVEDPDKKNLGAKRSDTRYSLRQKPVRNKKYYCTTLEGNYDNNLRGLPEVQSKWTRNEIIKEKRHAPKILKVYILPKISKLQEINCLDALPLDQIRALRVGHLLQKEMGITPRNKLLAEFLFKNHFVSGKNALHYQDLNDSYSIYRKKKDRTFSRRVTFQNDVIIEKPIKQMRVNFTALIASTFYCTSLEEISLLK